MNPTNQIPEDLYNQGIEILYKEYLFQKRICAPKEALDRLQKSIHSLYMDNPDRRSLPREIQKLAEDPSYISVRDMEPKNDPYWEAAVNDYGICNPPDSIEDMGHITDAMI